MSSIVIVNTREFENGMKYEDMNNLRIPYPLNDL
jgi:hypothetical protein